jgi:hypothetical protein
VDEFLGGVEVFHEVIVVVEFDYVDVVFCFSWTNSRHPPFRLIISELCVSQNPVVSSANSRSPASKMSSLGSTRRRSRRTQACCRSPVLFRRGISVRRCGWLRVKCGRHHGRYLRLRSVYIQLVYYNYQRTTNQPTNQ